MFLLQMATIVFCSVNKTAQTTRRCLSSRLKGIASTAGERVLLSSTHSPSVPLLPGSRWFSRGTSVRFMSHGTAGTSTAGRTRRGALALSGAAAVTAAAAVAGFLANANHFQRAEMATKVFQAVKKEQEGDILERCQGFMSPPVTDINVLQGRKDEMRTRMEMLIMETQADFCKALQKVDGGTFKVDRWERKEGGVELAVIVTLYFIVCKRRVIFSSHLYCVRCLRDGRCASRSIFKDAGVQLYSRFNLFPFDPVCLYQVAEESAVLCRMEKCLRKQGSMCLWYLGT